MFVTIAEKLTCDDEEDVPCEATANVYEDGTVEDLSVVREDRNAPVTDLLSAKTIQFLQDRLNEAYDADKRDGGP